MKPSHTIIGLSALIAMLALIAASTGLFWQDGGQPFIFTSLRGQPVQIYGQGLYRYDTLFIGAANKANDVVTLILGIPLLVITTVLYRRGSLRASLLLLGTLFYFLYLYGTYAAGIAFNRLFLVYIALFSASLFAFVLIFTSIDRQMLSARLSAHAPQRGLAIFMLVSGLVTLVIWLQPLVGALLQNKAPELLGTYTITITDVLDLSIITPATIIAGVLLLLRRAILGYLIAFALLVLEVMLAPMITAATISQLSAGIAFSTGAIVGPIMGFLILALVAAWMLVALLRSISPASTRQSVRLRTIHL